jgi:TolB-like protein/class 3 adenylate cyclase/Tfp pilus assembly protein PilF
MAAKLKSDPRLAIAHVLFIDVVGYSKLLVNEQREVVQRLNRIVRKTPQFRKSEADGKLIRIPVGDGMALVFFQTPEEPVRCAMEIARALKNHRHIRLRMGIHSGRVDQVKDVNDRLNVAGAGINVAKRVMDCGDAGHILLSKRVAEDLAQDRYWRPRLHELGEIELKHGESVVIVNLYTEELGNPQPPFKFATTSGTVPEKSIAVLPFENLSTDPENAFFAIGMQDQILTDLARIADLKVTSRTSVRQYETGVKRNIREIANALRVAHVVEGSVQRFGNRVRLRAQLIDAKTDTHLWAECYDRPLDDVFAIQSEVAKAVADQLRAKLTPAEKAAIGQRPTDDLGAYDRYVRAKTLLAIASDAHQEENVFQAVRLLEQAVARDKAFFLAYCKLAYAHEQLYYAGFDHTTSRLALADEALKQALELGPNRGEAHLAAAWIYYQCYFDYDRARSELAIARNALPNEPEIFALAGYMDRRQGRWEEHIRNLERAAQLDPRNIEILKNLAQGYELLRRFSDMAAVLDRMLAITPADPLTRVARASVDLHWHADTDPLHATIRDVLAEDPTAGPAIADQWFDLAVCERDLAETARALSSIPLHGVTPYCVRLYRPFYEGLAARTHEDIASANTAFTIARAEIENVLCQQPDYPEALCLLGMIDAGLGRKEDALCEARRAVELHPAEKDDPLTRAELIKYLAIVYAWTGEKELALDQLKIALQMPCPISQGQLRLHPYWDPLRGDPCFDKLVAESAMPVAIN